MPYEGPGKTPFTVIYAHGASFILACHPALLCVAGNAEDLAIGYSLVQELAVHLRSDIFAYEYPGYGSAEGNASERGCYDAADAAFKFVTNVAYPSVACDRSFNKRVPCRSSE